MAWVPPGGWQVLEMKRARHKGRPPSQAFSSCDKLGIYFTFLSVPSEELVLTPGGGDSGELPRRNVDLLLQALLFFKRSQKSRFSCFQMLVTNMYFLRKHFTSQTKHVQVGQSHGPSSSSHLCSWPDRAGGGKELWSRFYWIL